MRIALDAMGGDSAPVETVRGALLAAEEANIETILVGRRDDLEIELSRYKGKGEGIQIVHADEIVAMDEHPVAAVRAKRNSSIMVAMELVKKGEADAVVSAGNSGAVMAGALFSLGRIGGIERPAISVILPTPNKKVLLLDIGANADCKPQYLLQFAIMGGLYMEKVLGVETPSVALLSNGEEATKGNQLIQEAFPLLRQTGLNFVGNIEGKDLPRGVVDVVVTDGFVGNVALKLSEGLSDAMMQIFKEELNRDVPSQLGAALLFPALRRLKRRLDYTEVGGAPLLGVNGVCIVAHGRSDAKAIKSAIKMAHHATKHGLVEAIKNGIHSSVQGEPNARRNVTTTGITREVAAENDWRS